MPRIADPHDVTQIDVLLVVSDDDRSRWLTVPGEVIGAWHGGAEQMRCFTPRYGIRVRAERTVLAEVAFCFNCHNAKAISSPHTPRLPNWFTFDAGSPPAQELLHLFRACDPNRTQRRDGEDAD